MKEGAKKFLERALLAAVSLAVVIACGVLLVVFTPVKNVVLMSVLIALVGLGALAMFVLMMSEILSRK